MVVHGFKARRPGMYRGIPEGFSGMNTLHDYEDLHLLEQKAARKLASTAVIIKNAAGQADASTLVRQRMSLGSANANGDSVTKQADQYYETKFGGETVYARNGDDIIPFQHNRPSIVTQQYWDLLITQICCSYNVPKLLVVPYSLQGTVTRADLDVCSNAFRFNFEIIAAALRDIYEWQTDWTVRFDLEFRKDLMAASVVNSTPPQHLAVVIRPPRPPNVDIGYNANALIAELEAGTITYQDVFAERQQNWRHQFRQAAEAEQYIDQLAEEFGIDPERIAKKLKQPAKPEPEKETAEAAAA
jgi:capsid protein